MAPVIDYAWGRPGVTALKGMGAVAVCRYLSWLPNGKCLSRAEADELRAGGIDVVSNWEFYGDWTHDYSGGRAMGQRHAMEAAKQHLACGGPPDRPIYFSTDFAPIDVQLSTIAEYYRGVADVIGLARTGAYGGYKTIKYLFDHGFITWGWQTYAWSAGQWDPRAQLRQIRNGVQINGVDCDLDDSMAADFGQWGGTTDMGMEQSDKVRAWNGQSRDVEIGWVLGDLEGLRDYLTNLPDVVSKFDPQSGSRIDLIVQAAMRPAGRVELTDLDRQAIAADVAEIVGAKTDALSAQVTTLLARLGAAGDALGG